MSRIILNADDFGYDPAISRGIVEAMTHGIVSSTTMIVNSPWSEQAAEVASGLAVGLHLNLVRFGAVSERGRELVESEVAQLDVDFVAREAAAQLKRLEQLLGRPASHIDVHKHAHRVPAVLEGVARVARAQKLPVRSISTQMRQALRERGVRTNDIFLGDAGKDAYWTMERWAEQLAALPQGDIIIEIMCHPGYRPKDVESSYGEQREVELETFVSPEAREDLLSHGVLLSAWA